MSAARDQMDRMGELYRDREPEIEPRVPPHSVQSEQAVLSSLMLDPKALPKVSDWLAEEDFYRRDHRLIFRSILALVEKGKPLDAVTIGEWFEANALAEQIGGTGYLIELWNSPSSTSNITAHAEIVVEKSRLRQGIELGTELVNLGFARGATASDVSALAQSRLANMAPTRHTGLLPAKEGLNRWWDELLERVNRPGMIGLPTPWKGLNDITKGLRGGRVYVLAGRPGMGKSIIGCQLAAFTALRGVRTALFSLEMGTEEVNQRNVAALADVPHDFLESPVEDSPHWVPLNPAFDQLRRAPLLVDDTPALTANQLAARAERAHLQAAIGLVVVDHLHEMTFDARNRVDSIGDSVRRLKSLAKHLDVPVVLLAQLNRAGATRTAAERRPTLTDLRGAGGIEEVADVVIFVHREDAYDEKTHLKDVVELQIAKGRNIRKGTVYLHGQYDRMRADDWRGPLPQPEQLEIPQTGARKGGWRKGATDHKAQAAGEAADNRIRDLTGGG